MRSRRDAPPLGEAAHPRHILTKPSRSLVGFRPTRALAPLEAQRVAVAVPELSL
jgi:hypothetical protein